jgi:hypothetical protein
MLAGGFARGSLALSRRFDGFVQLEYFYAGAFKRDSAAGDQGLLINLGFQVRFLQ